MKGSFSCCNGPAGYSSPLCPGPVSRSTTATSQQILILVCIELHSLDVEDCFCIIKSSSLFLELQSVASQCITTVEMRFIQLRGLQKAEAYLKYCYGTVA